jgi:hypothetical protein
VSAGRVWLCWSPSQQAVDVRDEAESCKVNLEDFALNRPSDWITLAVFNSHAEASKFARQVQEMRNQRQGGADNDRN